MQAQCFNDQHQRTYHIYALTRPKRMDSVRNQVEITHQHQNSYTFNFKDVSIAKFKIDIKSSLRTDQYQQKVQNNSCKHSSQLWAINRHLVKQFNKYRAKQESNYISASNSLRYKSFRSQSSCNKHLKILTEKSAPQINYTDSFLQSKFTKSISIRTRRLLKIEQPKQHQSENSSQNKRFDDQSNYNFETLIKKNSRQCNLGMSAARQKRYKTEKSQAKTISQHSLTHIAAYNHSKYKKATNSLVLQIDMNLRRQRTMRYKTLDLKNR